MSEDAMEMVEMKEDAVTIDEARRLAQLVRMHEQTIRRLHSLERRIVRILLAHPEDGALAESTLEHLERKVGAAFALNSARMLGAREGVELDRLLAALPADESDDADDADDDTHESEGA